MTKTPKKLFFVLFLFVFAFLTLFVDRFHTERTLKPSTTCPACQFHNSSIATQSVPYLYRPPVVQIEPVEAVVLPEYGPLVTIDIVPRGPPQA